MFVCQHESKPELRKSTTEQRGFWENTTPSLAPPRERRPKLSPPEKEQPRGITALCLSSLPQLQMGLIKTYWYFETGTYKYIPALVEKWVCL